MLTEIMDHFGLARGLRQVGYFETDHHKQLLKELEAAIRESGLVALAGMVGCGKTTLLWQLQDRLKKEGRFAIAESLAVDVDRVNLSTLKLALFYDLATEKDGEPPTKPEKSERPWSSLSCAMKNRLCSLSTMLMSSTVKRCAASSALSSGCAAVAAS